MQNVVGWSRSQHGIGEAHDCRESDWLTLDCPAMDLNDLLNGLMTDMRAGSDTATMVGKPLKLGSSHMVPLLSVTIGFGTATTDLSGSGERRGGRVDGGGAGGTMVVTPRAFVVVGKDGSPQLVA